MSTPSSRIAPESGCSKPAISRSVVVLPQPDGPSIVKNSPPGISRSMPSTATHVAVALDELLEMDLAAHSRGPPRSIVASALERGARLLAAAEAPEHQARQHEREQRDDEHDRGQRVQRRRRRVARLRVDPHRHRRRVGAGGQVLRDHEVVDRQREDDAAGSRRSPAPAAAAGRAAATSHGGAPRSAAASSTSMPIVTSRPRTISTTHDIENVTWPITCAVVPSPMNANADREQQEHADREHELGRHQRQQHQHVRRRPSRGPRQRCSPSASAVPERRRDQHRQRRQHERLCSSAARSVGSLQHAQVRVLVQNQRSEKPCSDVRERPVVEREADRQQHRQQRPGDVEPGHDRQDRGAPRVGEPSRTETRRRRRGRLDRGHAASWSRRRTRR